jgi:hypothetical protein
MVCAPAASPAAAQSRPASVTSASRSYWDALQNETSPDAPDLAIPGAADKPLPEQPTGWLDAITSISQGRVQLEAGYVFLRDSAAGARLIQHTWPDMLLRVGLTERLEIRVGWPGFIDEELTDEASDETLTNHQTLDPNVGFMYDLWPQTGLLPQTAVLAAIPIAMEGNPLALESMQPLASLLYSWSLTEDWSLGGTTGIGLLREGRDDFWQFQQTAAVEWAIFDGWAAFVEWSMLIDYQSGDDIQQHLLSGGLAWALTDTLYVGWRAGVGLNDPAPDFLAGVRVAWRF